jgi:galactose mutarotase-like enzyme
MNRPSNIEAVRSIQGFNAYVLANQAVELTMVPDLGARIISLKDRRTGREWLWHPAKTLKLFKNRPFDDFAASPLVGMDECLPTIQPCAWGGRQLADHGEVWSQPWQFQESAGGRNALVVSLRLKHSPFHFKRTTQLNGSEVRFNYELTNLAAVEEKFVWSLHPLLRLRPGDELELPGSTRQLFNGNAWIDSVDSAIPGNGCAKVFAHPIRVGRAAIRNRQQADRLEFIWNPNENQALGLWLTRGGWHGHHHFAIEPTNAGDDSLAVAAGRNRCGIVAGGATVSWKLSLRVGT